MSNRLLDLRLIPEFNGSPTDVLIIERLEDLELTCELCKIDNTERILPLCLKGPVQETYQRLSKEQRSDVEEMKHALIKAYSMDSFVAFDHFTRRQLHPRETVDEFLMELQCLALLMGEMLPECWIRCGFVNGLPNHFKRLLRSSTRMEVLSLQELLERARAILINEKALEEPVAAALQSGQVLLTQALCDDCPMTTSTYFRYGGPNHLSRNCLTWNSRWNQYCEVSPAMCYYWCGKAGHLRRNCPGNGVRDEEFAQPLPLIKYKQ